MVLGKGRLAHPPYFHGMQSQVVNHTDYKCVLTNAQICISYFSTSDIVLAIARLPSKIEILHSFV
jgi:hypothetical protein